MTQIEQIKAEIERRLVKYDPDYTDAGQELQEMLAFIDSLPAESTDFEAEWKRYTATRKDDMRTNAVTMNVKEVARHFAEWQEQQAEKDLALTPDDIKRIVDIYDDCLKLTFEEGKPAYESEDFYKEVLKRFNTIQVPCFSINGKQGEDGVESSTEFASIPEWCGYPKHLRCMSLAKGYINGEEYCKKCDAYKGSKK